VRLRLGPFWLLMQLFMANIRRFDFANLTQVISKRLCQMKLLPMRNLFEV
jgi:hypothetical protein